MVLVFKSFVLYCTYTRVLTKFYGIEKVFPQLIPSPLALAKAIPWVALSETIKFAVRPAWPVLEQFELCDLLRKFKLAKSAESFRHRKSDLPTKFTLSNPASARLGTTNLIVSGRPGDSTSTMVALSTSFPSTLIHITLIESQSHLQVP
ncbi:unnamed protein product [Tuber melanosporum]|uniref:(Perigord truffle) hypothetical protein n=1 Tax=Tuber melanosporum (strain Mel28) TaxID=656061 RepID=D5GGG6_TUBMM|nr:uncharacterized protein GSTUM_00007376001 [Tuber melanosporum]CAZ83609.1 unnamed protein product [Tuber melanosporum]